MSNSPMDELGVKEEDMDEVIAHLLAQKAKKQKAREEMYGFGAYLGDSKVLSTNKRFLLNTIKNTSSYNQALKRMEQGRKQETVSKKKSEHRPDIRSIEFDESNPSSAFSCRLKAMVQHSKLATKSKKAKLPPGKTVIEAVLGKHIQEGVYGPLEAKSNSRESVKNNRPNEELPEDCPW